MVTSETKFVGIVSLIFFMVAIGALVWVLLQINHGGDQLKTYTTTIANNAAEQKQFETLHDLVEKTADDRAALQQFLLTKDKTVDLLAQIESIGQQQGAIVTTKSLQVKSEKNSDEELVISFEVTGSQEAVMRMLKILETLPYHSTVQTASLNIHKQSQTVLTITIAISLFSS